MPAGMTWLPVRVFRIVIRRVFLSRKGKRFNLSIIKIGNASAHLTDCLVPELFLVVLYMGDASASGTYQAFHGKSSVHWTGCVHKVNKQAFYKGFMVPVSVQAQLSRCLAYHAERFQCLWWHLNNFRSIQAVKAIFPSVRKRYGLF